MPSRGKCLLFGAPGISESKGDRRYFDLINATVDDRVIAQGRPVIANAHGRANKNQVYLIEIRTLKERPFPPQNETCTTVVGLGSPSCCIESLSHTVVCSQGSTAILKHKTEGYSTYCAIYDP